MKAMFKWKRRLNSQSEQRKRKRQQQIEPSRAAGVLERGDLQPNAARCGKLPAARFVFFETRKANDEILETIHFVC